MLLFHKCYGIVESKIDISGLVAPRFWNYLPLPEDVGNATVMVGRCNGNV